MQAVCISNRPAKTRDTLEFWAGLAPFVDRVLILCPGDQVGEFRVPGRLEVTAIDEIEALGPAAGQFAEVADHQLNNLLLRRAIATCGEVDDEFLMFDDDHRPLLEIGAEVFTEHGRHHRRHFYELARWPAGATSFDLGQHNTASTLAARDLPTLSYASHMPQIIDKSLFAQCFEEFADDIERGIALDEWSLYFNFAATRRADRFHPPCAFATLCWPALPTDWEYDVRPETPLFENFYEHLYQPGCLFGDLPSTFDERGSTEHSRIKITRRNAAQAAYERPSARLGRRLAWLLHRTLSRLDERSTGWPRSRAVVTALAPIRLARAARRAIDTGADPAFWRNYNRWP